jgi:histidinol-phosphate/aromatic aminotransferase/cobyric acid decarboxylase-like protein
LKLYLTERGMVIKFMEEDGLLNYVRITIGTKKQNRMLMNLIKVFLKENS